MKKEYTEPELNYIELTEDVITTSVTPGDGDNHGDLF